MVEFATHITDFVIKRQSVQIVITVFNIQHH
jgi:hypothetical protein